MKLPTSLALIIGSLFLSGCETVPTIGMTEKQWLLDTVLAVDVYTEGNVKAYRSDRNYYYFRDGILVKIDPYLIPAEKMGAPAPSPLTQLSAQMNAPSDVYSELRKLDGLRKDGIITEEEFQAQKKKILEQK